MSLKIDYLPQNLQSAHEVHQFDHDLDELKSWISEKEIMLDSENRENDLFSVQALIRKHEGLEVLVSHSYCYLRKTINTILGFIPVKS